MTGSARRAAAALALAAALPAAAYVLPSPGILRRLAERRAAAGLASLEVQGTLTARGEAAARVAAPGADLRGATPEVTVPARFQMKVPGRCRLELSPSGVAEAERPHVTVRDGKVGGPLAGVPAAVALVRSACTLLATPAGRDAAPYASALGRRGVALSEVTLGRFDGRIAYVVGGRAKDPKPLLFVDKDGFQPLRLIAAEDGALVDVRLLGWDSPTGGGWFPRAVEVFARDAALLRFTTERATANPKLPDALFP